MENIKTIIDKLELQPHPEGGYFKETYRSNGVIHQEHLGSEFIGDRNFCTGIYFLLTSDTFSAFHKINQDEMWHFYKGAPLLLHMITPKGDYSRVKIGNNFENNELPQFTVPAKVWFAAEVTEKNSYTLTGCTVAPGFDFRDFEMPEQKDLIAKFPEHSGIIQRLTR
ncbi:MAG: cupin domain-containing protein [Jejuia sp.]